MGLIYRKTDIFEDWYLHHIYTSWLVVYREDIDNAILEFRAGLRLAYLIC
jgi:hypothetical protein